MPPKMTGCFAKEGALVAAVRIFSSVLAHVSSQINELSGTVAALVTLERFLPRMCSNVCLQGTCY